MRIKFDKKKIIAVIAIVGGIGMACYPWISNWLYERGTQSEISAYEAQAEDTDSIDKEEELERAYEYDKQLAVQRVQITDPFHSEVDIDTEIEYDDVLSFNSQGLMGYIDIPVIGVYLPVYHGTDESVLQKGAGHLEGTSLPVGGTGTHCAISGHTGLNRAKLFTDLINMEEGDLFFIHVMDDVYAYRVVDINVTDPDDSSLLAIDPDRDLCTLVTCTPYGVNDHRLLVTGERTDYSEELYEEAESTERDMTSEWMRSYKQALLIGFACAATLVVVYTVINKKRERNAVRAEKKSDLYLPPGIFSSKEPPVFGIEMRDDKQE